MTTPHRIRVCLAITKGSWGGAQRYVYDLARSLSPERYEVLVITGSPGALNEELIKAGIAVETISKLNRDVALFGDLRALIALTKKLQALKPEVLHLNSSKMGLVGVLAGRLTGVPRIVFTAHGWAHNEERAAPVRFVLRLLHWLTVLGAHITIAVSEATRADLAHWPGARTRMHVVHVAPPPLHFLQREVARAQLRSRTGATPHEQTPWIGCIAELHSNKGLRYALSACAQLIASGTPLALFIIGEGEQRTTLEHDIAALGLEQYVFLCGFMSQAATLISAFDIFILPSITEAFPYTLLEAGQAGAAVIASKVGGIPELIEHGVTGLLVEPRSVGALVESITLLALDPERRARYGAALKERVINSYSLEGMVAETEKLYTGS